MTERISIHAVETRHATRLLSCGGPLGGRFVPFHHSQTVDVMPGVATEAAPTLDLNVSTLEDAFLLVGAGRDGVVFESGGRPIVETLSYADVSLAPYTLAHLRENAEPVDDPLFLAFDATWRNYYHWTILGLGQAMLYNRYRAEPARVVLFDRMDRDGSGWPVGFTRDVWREGLRRSGAVENGLFLKTGLYRVRTLDLMWIGQPGRVSVNQPPYLSYFPALYEAFRGLAGQTAAPVGKPLNLIIARPHDGRLSSTTAQVLEELTTHAGFRYVALETLAFADQLALFAAANLVVAPHGAGLANLVYATPTTKVVELNKRLHDEAHLRPWFYLIAAGMGQSYSYVDTDRDASDAGAIYDRIVELAHL